MNNNTASYQSRSLEDLKNTLSTMDKTTDKVSILLVLANKLGKISQYQESCNYAMEALEISRTQDHQTGIMEASHLCGVAYYQTGLQEKSLEYYFDALNIAKSLNITEYAMNILCDIGVAYSDIGKYEKAVEFLLKSIRIAEKLDQPGLLIKDLNNLGVVYLRKNELDVASKYFMDLKTLAENVGNPEAMASAHHNIGLICMKQKKYDLALKNFQASLKIARTNEITFGMVQNLFALGNLHAARGNRDHAIETFRQALEYGEKIDAREQISQIYHALSQLHKTGSDWEDAFHHLEKHCEIRQSIHRETTNRHIDNLHLHHRFEKQEAELNLSRKTNIELEQLNRDLDKMVARSFESEQNLQLLWDSIQTGVLIIDEKNHIIVDVNKTAAKLFGADHEDIIGRKCHSYICPALEGKCPISDRGETVNNSEKTLVRSNGSEIPILKTVVPIKINDRDHLLECFMDITDQKHTELTIRSMNEDLQKKTEALTESNKTLEESLRILRDTQSRLVQSEKMAALGEIVAGVAHEINTPVGVCITAASHMETKTDDLASLYNDQKLTREALESIISDSQECSRIIVSNLKRAAQLIRSFKQVAVDQTSEEFRNIYLKKYLDKILLNLHPQLKKTKHTVTVTCPEDLYIFTNPGLISQIVTNLVTNSLKHAFSKIDAGKIEIEVTQTGEILKFLYRDNGSGMSRQDSSRIFDPFFTTARGRGGSGLGMHLVYTIISQKLGGTIDCTTKPGKGIQFDIQIPLITTEP